jgi:hypothetical protein
MCPEFEMIDRQVTNDVSIFEAQIPFNPPQGKLVIDPKRAVKKFRRSAAGNYELSEDLRPPEVLLACTVYLMKDVLGDAKWSENDVSFAVLYAFIRDRLRAIRTDLTLQNCKSLSSIRIHELSIRFLIAASHLLCEEERSAFEPQQNNEQLNGCLSALREMYKAVRLTMSARNPAESELLRHEAEFQAYSIILSVDKKEAAVVISSLPLEILLADGLQVVLEAYSAFQETNYIKFLNLITRDPRTTYLQACLLHQFVLPIRQRALNAIISLPDPSEFRAIPQTDFSRWLAFVDQAELAYYSDRFGFVVGDAIDLSRMIRRGEACDLRAEEETFKFRKFQVSIEEARRKGRPLSDLMFEGLQDINYQEIMQVLDRGASNASLTSEFLAASTSIASPQSKNNFLPSVTTTKPLQVTQIPQVTQVAPPTIDHQAVLRKKLQEQALEKQARKDRIEGLSVGLLNALIDSVVGFHVAEVCAQVWESVCTNQRASHRSRIEAASMYIFDRLLDESILPAVLDVDLMLLRFRACNSLISKSSSIQEATHSLLNSLASEICQETISESLCEAKATQFILSRFFKRLQSHHKKQHRHHNNSFTLNLPAFPVHVVFACTQKDENVISHLLQQQQPHHQSPNPLSHLQSFLTDAFRMRMVLSDASGPAIVSFLVVDNCDSLRLSTWPTNYPGPTVLVTPLDFPPIDASEFPWIPLTISFPIQNLEASNSGRVPQATRKFDEILSHAFSQAATCSNLPPLQLNMKVSDFITPELIVSFVVEPFERLEFGTESLFLDLLRGLLEKVVSILFRGPQAARLLAWHPLTAGRWPVLNSSRKSSEIPSKFISFFAEFNNSFEETLVALDKFYGAIFIGPLDSLQSTHSLSEIIQTQNEIIRAAHKPKSALSTPSIDNLKEKLRSEAFESEAYEEFLKKFL